MRESILGISEIIDPEFSELVDKQTGEVYERDEIKIEGYRSKTA